MHFVFFHDLYKKIVIFFNFETLRPPQSHTLPPESPLEGPSALKYCACAQNQASRHTEPSQDSQPFPDEMGGGGAVQIPTSHAPGARVTVVTQTPSNDMVCCQNGSQCFY